MFVMTSFGCPFVKAKSMVSRSFEATLRYGRSPRSSMSTWAGDHRPSAPRVENVGSEVAPRQIRYVRFSAASLTGFGYEYPAGPGTFGFTYRSGPQDPMSPGRSVVRECITGPPWPE